MSMRVQQCVLFARYARSLSNLFITSLPHSLYIFLIRIAQDVYNVIARAGVIFGLFISQVVGIAAVKSH